jgi:hypothetical protein
MVAKNEQIAEENATTKNNEIEVGPSERFQQGHK